MDRTQILETLKRLAQAEKVVSPVPEWKDLVSSGPPKLQISASLWIGNSVEHGLKLDVHCPKVVASSRPFADLVAVMHASIGGNVWHLGRIEFDPSAVGAVHHRNPFGMKDVRPEISGSHIHPFDLNLQLGLDAFSPSRNLPLAVELAGEYTKFDEILAVVRERFCIPGFWIEEPQWQKQLI